MAKLSTIKRFWSRVDKTDTCWLWKGSIIGNGYGSFYVGGKNVAIHRMSYQILVKQVPIGLQLDHLCRIKHCVNPDHLEVVTQSENLLRGHAFKRGEYRLNKKKGIWVKKRRYKNGHPHH